MKKVIYLSMALAMLGGKVFGSEAPKVLNPDIVKKGTTLSVIRNALETTYKQIPHSVVVDLARAIYKGDVLSTQIDDIVAEHSGDSSYQFKMSDFKDVALKGQATRSLRGMNVAEKDLEALQKNLGNNSWYSASEKQRQSVRDLKGKLAPETVKALGLEDKPAAAAAAAQQQDREDGDKPEFDVSTLYSLIQGRGEWAALNDILFAYAGKQSLGVDVKGQTAGLKVIEELAPSFAKAPAFMNVAAHVAALIGNVNTPNEGNVTAAKAYAKLIDEVVSVLTTKLASEPKPADTDRIRALTGSNNGENEMALADAFDSIKEALSPSLEDISDLFDCVNHFDVTAAHGDPNITTIFARLFKLDNDGNLVLVRAQAATLKASLKKAFALAATGDEAAKLGALQLFKLAFVVPVEKE